MSGTIAGYRYVLVTSNASRAPAGFQAVPDTAAATALLTPVIGAGGTTITTPAAGNYLLMANGSGGVSHILPSDFINSAGSQATDTGITLATGLAAGDRIFSYPAGGGAALALTGATLIAAVQSAIVASGVFAPASAPAVTISAPTPSGWTAGAAVTLTSTYTGTAPTGVNVGFTPSGGALSSYTALTGFTASGGTWSGAVVAPAAGNYTVTVQETNNSAVTATSGSFTVAAAPKIGPDLTMTGATYDGGTGAFGQALTGGWGQAALTLPTGPRSFAARFKASTAPTADSGIVFDNTSNGLCGIYINASGNIIAVACGAHITTTISGVDNVIHDIEMCINPAASGTGFGTLWVDGALAGSTASPGGGATPAPNPIIYVAAAGSVVPSGAGYNQPGSPGIIYEVAVFNTVKRTAAFTAPAAPYTPSEPGIMALWHLDGSGASA